MSIYDTGTASLAASGLVTGVGTQWTMPLTLIRVGATIVFKTEPVQIYTISEITSDTLMAVYNPNGETVPSGTGYAILAHDGITVQGLAQDVAETLRYYQSRETEIADAVDAFNNFDSADFESKVNKVNTQHGDVISIGAQVENNKDLSLQYSQMAEDSSNQAAQSAEMSNGSAIRAESAAQSVSGALVGSFAQGVTLESSTQQIFYINNGVAYSYVWGGSLPKVVPPNSTPQTSGGISKESWIEVGRQTGMSEFSPEKFGAITDDENFDCLPAIIKSIETGVLYLSPGKTYYVNDEVVIPSGLLMFTNSATIKASPNGDWFSRKKAVVRASSMNVGESPDLTMPEQQTRGVRHLGVLNIDANNLADHAYYGFGVVAESTTDVIYAYNATNTGIVIIGSWYHKVNKYMSVNCARGVCIGYPINGETGDTFVNAISFGAVYAYDTTRSSTYGFDPYGNINAQLIGAGVILGKALGSSIGVLTAETTSGAGLATANAVNWSVNTAYFEKCGLSAIDPANPDVAILSTTANIEDHAIDFGNVHFGISTGIFHRYESTEFINIDSIYRIDRKITWNTNSKERSAYVKYGNYYYLDAYSYTKPKFITNESGVDVLLSDFGLVFRDYSSAYSRDFVFPGGDVYFNCGISTGSVSGVDFQITSDDGIQYITASSSPYSIRLSGKRTAGNVYKILFATPNPEASGDGYVYLSRTKDTQWRQ